MKVLSDWHTGTPPMPGLWLVRAVAERKWSFGLLLRWNGSTFVFPDEVHGVHAGPHIEWRGLAFDPLAVEIIPDAETPFGTRQRYGYWIPLP